MKAIVAVLGVVALLVGCGGGGDGDGNASVPATNPEISINLSGLWAGTWSGKDPVEGDVQGHWEAEVAQHDRTVNGSFVLSGDVDCPEGDLDGSVDEDNLFSGTILRLPCQQNRWLLNAVNLDERSASGAWDQLGSGASGTFTGIQVATPGGPRIAYFHPPGGKAGSILTIVGERYAATATDNLVLLNGVGTAVLNEQGTSRLTTTVPGGVLNGPITLKTQDGLAISPRAFISDVTSPTNIVSKQIALGRGQVGLAVNPDGRRIYYAANHGDPGLGGLLMVDAASQEILSETPVNTATNVTLQGVAVSPDGRRVYVACEGFGVCVFDAINNLLKVKIPVGSGQEMKLNPQGLALSPDGQLLYVADNRDGGAVAVVNTDNYQVVASVDLGPGVTPQGVTANPDGKEAYFAFSAPVGQNGQVLVYNVDGGEVASAIEVGDGPIGLAVTPDGRTLYVSNEQENTVDVIDLFSQQIAWTIPVSAGPTGLAISPDGQYVYIACRFSNLIDIIPVGTTQVMSSLSVYPDPVHLAFTPDGRRAYVSHASFGFSEEIGGRFTLSVAIAGGGIGIVSSAPGSINCGASCQDTFENGTAVFLTATPDHNSYFAYWDGDPDCQDGVIAMNTNKYCVAVFNSAAPPTAGTKVYGEMAPVAPGCFIATAAYGSYLDPHVQVLRDFRDDVLLTNPVGQVLVEFYYTHSPPIAALISEDEGLRAATRVALTPLVFGVKYPAATILLGCVVLGFVVRRFNRARSV